MTLARLVILNEVKDLWQNDPLPLSDCGSKVVERLTPGGGEDGRIIGVDDLCRLLDNPHRWIVQ
jgi:hypothetical protein